MTADPLYLRPVPLIGMEAAGPDALPLAGGALRFEDVEALTRGPDGARQSLGRFTPQALRAAHPEREEEIDLALARLTAPRAPVCGLWMDRPRVMGVLNLTPDSFSDGGAVGPESAAARVAAMAADGAEFIDIGGESTRPGADFIMPVKEYDRIRPGLEAMAECGAVLSVDTRKAAVARAAMPEERPALFNDVSALSFDPDSPAVAAEYAARGGAVCLMHARGDPKTMQRDPRYDDVLLDVYDYLAARVAAAEAAGVPRSAIIVDPGIGFGKTLAHNLDLLRGLSLFHGLGCPVLLGASRKRFIGTLADEPEAARRAPGSLAAALWGAQQGVQILRVHDVRETAQALAVLGPLSGIAA